MNHLLSFSSVTSGTPNSKSGKVGSDGRLTEPQFHQACGHGVDSLLVRAMKSQSLDNLSVVMIGLRGFRIALEKAYAARKNQNSSVVGTPSNQNSQPISLKSMTDNHK